MRARLENRGRLRAISPVGVFGPLFFFFFFFHSIVLSVLSLTPRVDFATFVSNLFLTRCNFIANLFFFLSIRRKYAEFRATIAQVCLMRVEMI